MRNGQQVVAFEGAFADYVGARWAIGMTNGTCTLQAALVAIGIEPGQSVCVPPLTMSATTIAVLLAGGVPWFVDVDPDTWLMAGTRGAVAIPVSLYGLHYPHDRIVAGPSIDDAAQTLRKHDPRAAFTSFSFQKSKILSLGEGGMLVTDSEELAVRAREYTSLGYRMAAGQSRIDSAAIKCPDYARHYSLGINARMNDLTAAAGLKLLKKADALGNQRQAAAVLYWDEVRDCSWLTSQDVSNDKQQHDYWCFPVAADTPERATQLADAVVKHGGERPYPAWRLTYTEPAFKHLAPKDGCPVAESLQPRLLQFATNDLKSAEKNAQALRRAIEEIA